MVITNNDNGISKGSQGHDRRWEDNNRSLSSGKTKKNKSKTTTTTKPTNDCKRHSGMSSTRPRDRRSASMNGIIRNSMRSKTRHPDLLFAESSQAHINNVHDVVAVASSTMPSETISFTVSNATEDTRQDWDDELQGRLRKVEETTISTWDDYDDADQHSHSTGDGGAGDCCVRRSSLRRKASKQFKNGRINGKKLSIPQEKDVGEPDVSPRSSSHASVAGGCGSGTDFDTLNDEIGFEVIAATNSNDNNDDDASTESASASSTSSAISLPRKEAPISESSTEYQECTTSDGQSLLNVQPEEIATYQQASLSSKSPTNSMGVINGAVKKEEEADVCSQEDVEEEEGYARHFGSSSSSTSSSIVFNFSGFSNVPSHDIVITPSIGENQVQDVIKMKTEKLHQNVTKTVTVSQNEQGSKKADLFDRQAQHSEGSDRSTFIRTKLPIIEDSMVAPADMMTVENATQMESMTAAEKTVQDTHQLKETSKYESLRSKEFSTVDSISLLKKDDDNLYTEKRILVDSRRTEDSSDEERGSRLSGISSDLWEADLIHDCVETGLPVSPRNTKIMNGGEFCLSKNKEEDANLVEAPGGSLTLSSFRKIEDDTLQCHPSISPPPLLSRHGLPDSTKDVQPIRRLGRPDDCDDLKIPSYPKRSMCVSLDKAPILSTIRTVKQSDRAVKEQDDDQERDTQSSSSALDRVNDQRPMFPEDSNEDKVPCVTNDDERLPRIEVSLLPSVDSSSGQDEEKSRYSDCSSSQADPLELKATKTEESRSSRKPVLKTTNKPWKRDDCTRPEDLSVSYISDKSFDSGLTDLDERMPIWRLDPVESLADFNLEILNEKTGCVTTYHIHKHVVAVGPRRSEFLDELYQSKKIMSYRLSLDDRSSSLIPQILDFMYCGDRQIDVSTITAAPLRQLGRIFKIIPLVVKVAGFILDDMDTDNVDTYVADSCFYSDDNLKTLIVANCAENIEIIDIDHDVWTVMPHDLLLRVLTSSQIDRDNLSCHLSLLLKEYFARHGYEIDADIFLQLTSEDIIPLIDRNAALPLIELCEKYDSRTGRCESLQRRCADAMACFWKTFSPSERHRLFGFLRNLPSSFTVDFLELVESEDGEEILRRRRTHQGRTQHGRYHTTEKSISIGILFDGLAGEDGYSLREGGNEEDLLSWRLDALHSYSDWSIRVKHLKHPTGDVYHVHKHVLSIGHHRSDFFAKQFLSSRNQELTASNLSSVTKQGWTTVELDHKAAAEFPRMLDFIYSPAHELKVSRSASVALRFLSRVFEVPALSNRVLDFIEKDLSLSNVLSYIQAADSFEDERVIGMAARLCARDIRQIDIDSDLLEEFKPNFFAKVVSSEDLDPSAGCHVTIIVTRYFSLHDLDEVFLGQLLRHTGKIDDIDYVSAMKLLKTLSGFKSQDILIFDEMQKKCSSVLTENWNEIRRISKHRENLFEDIFPRLDPKHLTEIFDVIDRKSEANQRDALDLHSRAVREYQKQLAEVKAQHEQEVSLLRKELDVRTGQMLSVQQALESRLGKVQQSLSRRTGRSTASLLI